MRITPPSKEINHFISSYITQVSQEEYVKLRKKFCDFMTSLNAIILVPICEDCYSIKCHSLELNWEPPHIVAETWKNDIAFEVGLTEVEIQEIESKINNDEDMVLRCNECRNKLEYGKDNFYVESISFEEHFHISGSVSKKPSKQLKRSINKLYGNNCYGCGKKLTRKDTSYDHIIAKHT